MAKNWSDYFSDSFQQGMKNAQSQKELEAQQEYRQSVLDANLAEKGFERAEGESQNTDKVGIVERLGRGLMAFGDGMTGSHTYDSYMTNRARMAEEQGKERQRQVMMDVTLYSKGLERITDEQEIKQLLHKNMLDTNQAKAKGQPYDPTNTGGLVANYGNNVLRVGNAFYKYNPKADTSVEDLANVKAQLDQAYNTGGTWNPSSVKVGNSYFKFTPTDGTSGKKPDPVGAFISQSLNKGNPNGPQAEVKPLSPKDVEMRKMVAQAIADGMKGEELANAIKEEGYDPTDFTDMFNPVMKEPVTPTQAITKRIKPLRSSRNNPKNI